MEKSIYALWDQLHGQLEGFVQQKVQDKAASEDIIQEVFLKVQLHIGKLRDQNKITPWIFQVTRNQINDYFRHGMKYPDGNKSVYEQFDTVEEQDPDQLTKEFAQCMIPLIDYLPANYKEALTLVEIEGLSQKELAQRLGISYSGAKSRVQRGREMLKTVLLQCCDIETDSYGNVMDYHRRPAK